MPWAGSGVGATVVLTRRASAPFEEPAPDGAPALRLRASDGVGIGAWELEGGRDVAVVMTRGNGGARSGMTDHARALASRGRTVLAITVRAQGDSEGDTNDIEWSARRAVNAASRAAPIGARRSTTRGASCVRCVARAW